MKKLISYILISIAIATVFVATASAAEINNTETSVQKVQLIATKVIPTYIPKPDILPGPTPEQQEKTGTRTIFTDQILPAISVGMIGMVGGISLVFLVISGVRFTTAYGNEESITKAKDQALYSIAGFIVALLAYAIVTAITRVDIQGQAQQVPTASPESTAHNPQTVEPGPGGRMDPMP